MRAWAQIAAGLIVALSVGNAAAEVVVHTCRLSIFDKPLIVTIYDDGSPSRIGNEVGVGSRAFTHFDPPTGATVVVEFNGGDVPTTLTTINSDGRVVHSRHLVGISSGWFHPSQTTGQCTRRSIP